MKKDRFSSCLKRLGIFNASRAAAITFSSNIFRIVAGVLANVPADSIAIVTSIEFTLNWILEIPTGYLSDRFGRIPLAIIGYFLVMTGLFCIFFSVLNIFGPEINRTLFVIHGICIGVGKPLISGSVEGFYQDALNRITKEEKGNNKQLDRSFTLSQAFGQYITTLAVFGSFLVIYLTHKFDLLAWSFLPPIFLYGLITALLFKDYRFLGDPSKKNGNKINFLQVFKKLKKSKNFYNALFYNSSFHMILVIPAGYFILTIGRMESITSPILRWSIALSFLIGYSSLGWILKSNYLPKILLKYSERKCISICYLLILGVSLISFSSIGLINNYIFVLITLIFGAICHFATDGIQGISKNLAIKDVSKEEYSTTFSFLNMPGFAWVGFYSFYLAQFRNGAPTTIELFLSILLISLLLLLVHKIVFKEANINVS